MFYQRQCVFAYPVKPCGMRDPFHIQFLKKYPALFLHFWRLLKKVIENDAIVYSFDFSFLSLIHIEEFRSLFYQFSQANRFYANIVLGTVKINSGFLHVWKYFKQNHIFRRMVSQASCSQT